MSAWTIFGRRIGPFGAALMVGAATAWGADETFSLSGAGLQAIPASAFLDSLGVNTHADQGYPASAYVGPLRYLGVRDIRDGVRAIAGFLMLHRETGVRVDVLGGDVEMLLAAADELAARGALLSVEGPNEPNNFPITYEGKRGGGRSSWAPVARYQSALYGKLKSDPLLRSYPVFDASEAGAESDDVGLQFLTIPVGSGALLRDGTRFADYANVHNYVSSNEHRHVDNQAWKAADPLLRGPWDGLYGEYGRTWAEGYSGYSDRLLESLPRVTTETGWDSVSDSGSEKVQADILVDTYLAQFKRGWRYTFIYELRDGEGGAGHQGLFRQDWSPKPAATYIHNLTSILDDGDRRFRPGQLNYGIIGQTATVHDLLLAKSDGAFELVVWGEQVSGQERLEVSLGETFAAARIYDVARGIMPVRVVRNVDRLAIDVSNHPVVIELR